MGNAKQTLVEYMLTLGLVVAVAATLLIGVGSSTYQLYLSTAQQLHQMVSACDPRAGSFSPVACPKPRA